MSLKITVKEFRNLKEKFRGSNLKQLLDHTGGIRLKKKTKKTRMIMKKK